MIAAAQNVIPFAAAFCVVNRIDQPPVYLCDTYREGSPKEAVQRYIDSTYLLNPLYNAFLAGLQPGLHRMIDLAPDNWQIFADPSEVVFEQKEEIGFRTRGWPENLQELALTVDFPNGMMGEISLARPSELGGFSPEMVARLQPFYPLFATAFRHLWARNSDAAATPIERRPPLDDFAVGILSPREAEIVQLILKGHSSLSISLTLEIALPTVKTHRKNAYAKLGISTQQQLLNTFLQWQETVIRGR
ncbi:LuxR family transcriptional regulator [Sulfitobacter sp. SK012]|nr:LuxR family transcriptional regulator [Sulfitobacter sp. SK012]